jgi:hypothetical protein
MTHTAKLTASDGASSDKFGISAAISGNTVVVGAHYADNGVPGSDRGAAYVFVKPPAGWSDMNQNAKLTASNPVQSARFGEAVAISGTSILVGAGMYNDGSPGTGRAYVFNMPRTGWVNMTETAKLSPSPPLSDSHFGEEVSISDNVAVVAANNNNNGSSYVFVRPTAGWQNSTETAKLTASDMGLNDVFSKSIAISGEHVVVGSYRHDGLAGGDEGNAYVYRLNLADCNANGLVDLVDIAAGTGVDIDGNGIPDECDPLPCVADIAGGKAGSPDGIVNLSDLLLVINQWGQPSGTADINADGIVNAADLLQVLNAWGVCTW